MASYYAETKQYHRFLNAQPKTPASPQKKIIRRIGKVVLVLLAIIFRQYLFLIALGGLFVLYRVMITSDKILTRYRMYPVHLER